MSSTPGARRRGAALENAILDAAWDELVEVGHDNVTVAAVAARAGTNKAALYRRWPHRADLLAAAIDRHVVPLGAWPSDTGALRTDVIALLNAIRHRCAAINATPGSPEAEFVAQIRRRAAEDGFAHMKEILTRAFARNEADQRAVDDHILRLPVNVLYSELALNPASATDQLAATIVDEIFLPLVRARSAAGPH